MRVTRPRKLRSIPAEWLLPLVHNWLFSGLQRTSILHAVKLLENAATQTPHEEASWLRHVLVAANVLVVTKAATLGVHAMTVLKVITVAPDKPWKLFYIAGLVLHLYNIGFGDDVALIGEHYDVGACEKMLEQSAREGFVPAMTRLGMFYQQKGQVEPAKL